MTPREDKIKIASIVVLLVLLFVYSIGYLLAPKIIVYDNKKYDFYKYAKKTFGAPTYLYGTVNYAKGEFKSAEHFDYDAAVFHKPISILEASQILTYISEGGNAVFIMSQELAESAGFKSLFEVFTTIEDLKLPPQADHFMIRSIDWRYAKREVPWEKDFKVVQYALNQQSALLKRAQLGGNPLVITSPYNKGRFSLITFDLGNIEKWKYSGNFLARVIYLTIGVPFLYYLHPLYSVAIYLTIAIVISSLLLIEFFCDLSNSFVTAPLLKSQKRLLDKEDSVSVYSPTRKIYNNQNTSISQMESSGKKKINFSLFLHQNRKELVIFCLIILLASIVRLWDITSLLPIPVLDELWCILNTKIMFEGKGFVFGTQYDVYEVARQSFAFTPFWGITLIPIKLGEMICGNYYLGLRLSKAILSVISIVYLYFFTRNLFNKRTATLSILIVTLSQWHYVISGIKNVLSAGYIIIFLITCLWLFWWGVKKDSKYFIPFGIFMGVMPEINITYIMPLILIFFVVTDKDARKSILKPNFWIGILIITIFIFPNLLVKHESGFGTYKYFYNKTTFSNKDCTSVENQSKIWKVATLFFNAMKAIFKKFFIRDPSKASFQIGNKPVFELIEYIFALPALIFIFFKGLKGNNPERFMTVWFIAGVLPTIFVAYIFMYLHLFIICLPALSIIIARFLDFIYEKLRMWNTRYLQGFIFALISIFAISGYQLFNNYMKRYSIYNSYMKQNGSFDTPTVYYDDQKEVITQGMKMGNFLEEFQKKEPDVHIVVENWDVEKLILLGTTHAYLRNLWIGNGRFVASASLSVPGFMFDLNNIDKTKVLKWEKGKKTILYIHTTDFGAQMFYPSLYAGWGVRSNIYKKLTYIHPDVKPLRIFRYLNGKPIFEIYKVVPNNPTEVIVKELNKSA